MKDFPRANYPIKIFSHTEEYEEPDSKYFQGIYGINLNHWIKITLSPAYDYSKYSFPPDPAKALAVLDVNDIKSEEEAKLLTVLFGGGLILLANNDQAGSLLKLEHVSAEIEDESLKAYVPERDEEYRFYYIYCISSEEYKLFASELEEIMDMGFFDTEEKNSLSARMSYMVLENLKKYKCISLIHALITTNSYILSPYERELLGLD
jgi:hypothetical protein